MARTMDSKRLSACTKQSDRDIPCSLSNHGGSATDGQQSKSTPANSSELHQKSNETTLSSTTMPSSSPNHQSSEDSERGPDQRRRAGLRRQPSMINLHNKVVTLNEVGRELFDVGNYSNSAFHFGEALDILIGLLKQGVTRRRSNEDDDMEKFQQREAESSEFYKSWLREMELNIIKGEISCFPIDPKFQSFLGPSSVHSVSLTVMYNLASVHLKSNNLLRAEEILKLAIQEVRSYDLDEQGYEDEVAREAECDGTNTNGVPVKSRRAPKKLQFVLMVMSIYNSLGQINLRQCQDQYAMVCFLDGINYGQEHIGLDHVLSAHMYTTIGQNLFQNGFSDEAILAFEEASKIFNRVGKVGGFGLERIKKLQEKPRARAA